jgi:hypothetical protein
VADFFKSERRKAAKLADHVLVSEIGKALHAVHSLASQIERANTIRIVADYHPETAVVFTTVTRFELENVPVTEAHNWADNAKQYARIISTAWNQTNV